MVVANEWIKPTLVQIHYTTVVTAVYNQQNGRIPVVSTWYQPL